MSSGSDSEEFESADEGEVIDTEQSFPAITEGSSEGNIENAVHPLSENITSTRHIDTCVNSSNELQDETIETDHQDKEARTAIFVTTCLAEDRSHESTSSTLKVDQQAESKDHAKHTPNNEIPPELLSKVATRKVPSKERPRTKPTLGAKKLGAVKISNSEFQNFQKLPDIEKSDEAPRTGSTTSRGSGSNSESSLKKLEVSTDTDDTARETGKGWGWWAPPRSLLSSVSSLTTQILSTVEAGLNIPDPEDLARNDCQERKAEDRLEANGASNTSSKEEALSSVGLPFIGGMSSLTRLVETTGTRVLSTGLDTLELLGKKTMNVLQENDPGLKKARAALVGQLTSNKPSLSQVLREAKERQETGTELSTTGTEDNKQLPALLDHHQGLMHLEALEMLSDQCSKQVRSVVTSSDARNESICRQIRDACELDEESEDVADVEPWCPDLEILEASLASALKSVTTDISYAKLIRDIQHGYGRVQTEEPAQFRTLALDSLARLVSTAVEIYHKCGELLMLEKTKSAQLDWETMADSLVKYSVILRTEIQRLAEFYVVKVVQSDATSTEHSTDIYMEASKCTGYVKTALRLMIPILQHCAMK